MTALEPGMTNEKGNEVNEFEREAALSRMQQASHTFYASAVSIGVHPFIEFCGLMNEYIKACEAAHRRGQDFTEFNAHTGKSLPMESYMVNYVNEKLECIFIGHSVGRK